MKSAVMNRDEICSPQSETLMFPGLRNFKRSTHLCKQFHGSVVVIQNKTQSDYLNDQWWKMNGGTVSPYGLFLQRSPLNRSAVLSVYPWADYSGSLLFRDGRNSGP